MSHVEFAANRSSVCAGMLNAEVHHPNASSQCIISVSIVVGEHHKRWRIWSLQRHFLVDSLECKLWGLSGVDSVRSRAEISTLSITRGESMTPAKAKPIKQNLLESSKRSLANGVCQTRSSKQKCRSYRELANRFSVKNSSLWSSTWRIQAIRTFIATRRLIHRLRWLVFTFSQN